MLAALPTPLTVTPSLSLLPQRSLGLRGTGLNVLFRTEFPLVTYSEHLVMP